MRLTVGPLPPSVYWRRRALVFGVLGLIVVGIAYAVSGGPSAGNEPLASTSSATATPTGSPTPTAFTLPVSSITGGPATTTPALGGANCTDAEIQLTASSSPSTIQVNGTASFTLTVKNISNRTCTRNTGSIPQELRLRHGTVTVWSSDDCVSGTPYDFDQAFTPGFEKVFTITWDGFRTRDDNGAKLCARPGTRPVGGAYELVARLGTLLSPPASVTIRSGS